MSKIITPIPVLAITSVHASGLPNRQLQLGLRFRNPLEIAITILDAWFSVSSIGGMEIAQGRLLRTHGSQVDSREESYAELVVPIYPSTLQHIETRRAGGDVDLRISSQVLICQIQENNGALIMSDPSQTYFDQRSRGHFEYKIPQSDWIKLLASMQWSELELIEMPSRNMRALPIPARAIKRFEEAQHHYRQGHWSETMASCRIAFEALVKEVTGKDNLAQALLALNQLLGENPKTDCLDKLISGFSPFLHLARHEQQPPVPIGPAEATLALRVTGSILAYIGESPI